MIQTIPLVRGGRSFSQKLNEGLGRGLEMGSQLMQAHQAQKQQQQQMQQENAALKQLTGQDFSGISDPKLRQQAVGELLKQQGKQQALGQKQNYLEKLFGDQSQNTQQEPSNSKELSSQGFDPSKISDEDIVKATAMDPTLGRELRAAKDSSLKERRHKEDVQIRKDERRAAETIPMKQRIAENAQSAMQSLENKERQLELIDRGDLNDPTFASLMDKIPGKLGQRFLSNDTVQYKASLVDEYKDLRNIFQGQTRVKELEILENKIADTYYTDEQKKRIIKARMKSLDADLIKAEVAAEIDQNKPNLGILEFTKELNKRTKERMKSVSDQVIDDLTNVQKEAETQKSRSLDVSNPQDANIMTQILREAGGDVSKAYKIAEKKGYKVKR
jgi:hypothetical protein